MSIASTTPFFGRSYELSITTKSSGQTIIVSSDTWEPEALRFTFDIRQIAFGQGSAYWFADIEIFNCDGTIPGSGNNLAQTVISEGDQVTVRAGYQADGDPQIIWQGQVFQPVWERIDVTDYKLTLHCFLGRAFSSQNFINQALTTVSTARQQAEYIAANSVNPIPLTQGQLNVLDTLAPGQLPGGKTYFGNPHDYLVAIARHNGMVSWLDQNGFNMAPLYNPTDPAVSSTSNAQTPQGSTLPVPVGPILATYAPCSPLQGPPIKAGDGTTLSLIGTPQQTQYGVNFKVLLDSRIKMAAPLPQVKLALQYIRQAQLQIGTLPARPLVSQYVVVGVRHVGDTRGNPWYSEVMAYSQVQNVIALLGN